MAFLSQFVQGLVASAFNDHTDNWPEYRFGPPPVETDLSRHLGWTQFVLDHAAAFEALSSSLADEDSRVVLRNVLLFRALGHRKVLHHRHPGYAALRDALRDRSADALAAFGIEVLDYAHKTAGGAETLKVRLPKLDLTLLVNPGFLHAVVRCRQYLFGRRDTAIRPAAGDVVVDCGGACGDTALLFAALAGPAGRVLSFEFGPDTLALFHENMALNPGPAARIEIVERAVHRESGWEVRFDLRGPSTRIGAAGSHAVRTMSIDDLVNERNLPRVDFIKMDIEGAEADALRGARATIARFRPKLAVSLYHRPQDLFELPSLIRSIVPDYQLYLDHHTIHAEETVMYACPPPDAS